MGEVTLGTISSHPNDRGEHSLNCPNCSHVFLSIITKNDGTDMLKKVSCAICGYNDDPKQFIAAAHRQEVNTMATNYVQSELNKALSGKHINLDLRL